MFLLCAFIYVTLSTSQRRDSELSSKLAKANSKITTTNTNLAKTNTVLENRKPIIVDSTAQGTVNWDTNNFLKSGVTYAFVVTVSSNLNSESYKQEISCALNSVNMGNNGNYYKQHLPLWGNVPRATNSILPHSKMEVHGRFLRQELFLYRLAKISCCCNHNE